MVYIMGMTMPRKKASPINREKDGVKDKENTVPNKEIIIG